MSEQFVFDEKDPILIHAYPNFRKYTIPKNVTKIADGNITHYVFADVSIYSNLWYFANCSISDPL